MNATAGLHRKPYIIQEGYVAPTFTAIAPTTGAASAGTVAVTLTGTFVAVGGQFVVWFDGVTSACVLTSPTTLTATLSTAGKAAGVYKVMVFDAMGNKTAQVNFTVT